MAASSVSREVVRLRSSTVSSWYSILLLILSTDPSSRRSKNSVSLLTLAHFCCRLFDTLLICEFCYFLDKKVFPDFYVLGWYSTGSDATESDMHIHKAVSSVALMFNINLIEFRILIVLIVWGFHLQLMDINESPVYVLLNPAINHAQKDLPVTIYESGKIGYLHHWLSYCFIDYNLANLSLIVFKTWRVSCHWWNSSVDFRAYQLHYWGMCLGHLIGILSLWCESRLLIT